jgi:hypothetical protein
VIAAAWALSLALVLWRVPARPGQALYYSLAPAVLGLFVACLYIGQVPRVPEAGADCDLLLASVFFAQRHLFLGLLASGSLFLGTLPLLVPRERATIREAWWVFVVALATLVAAAVWTFVDPAMPAKAQVGDYAVRGLWVLVGGGAVLWLWARLFSRVIISSTALPAILAAACGFFMLVWALVSYHRACGLYRLTFFEPALAADLRVEAGVVAATALARLLPFLSISVLAAIFLGRVYLKKIITLVVVLLVPIGMGAGFELGWRSQYQERCAVVLPADLQLPDSRSAGVPGPGSLLVVSQKAAWLEGELVLEGEIPALGERTDTPRQEALNLAADSRLRFERLYTFLRAAGVAGWYRFNLVVRPPLGERCIRESRLYGVCLAEHFSYFKALPFEIAHFEGNLKKPQEGVTANLIVEPGRMEVSFGGFGVSPEELDSLGAELPDRLGTRDTAGLVEALQKARERFEDSRTLILLPHDGMTTREVVALLDSIRQKGPAAPFPQVIISRLLR